MLSLHLHSHLTTTTRLPNAHCPPTKGHTQCSLPINWSCQTPAAHQSNVPPCLLPTNQRFCPMLAAHQQWSPAAHQLVVSNACCPPIGRTQCLPALPTNQTLYPMPAAHQPKGYDQCPNQKVVPNTSCPPTKTCPMLTAHQTRKFGHHYMYLLLLSVPLNHKAVPNAHCCTNCAMSKACCPTITRLCPTITRLCPLHAAQGHILCMWLRAVSNTCCPTPAYGCQQHAQYLLLTICLLLHNRKSANAYHSIPNTQIKAL